MNTPSFTNTLRGIAATFVIGLAATITASANPAAEPALTAAEAQRDLRILERAFNELHPGLLRYTDAATLQAAFAQANEAVASGATARQMFLLSTRLAASLRCGHTWTNPFNQGGPVRAALFDAADKLPLTLRFVAGRMLVTGSAVSGNAGVAGVAAGSELLAIDGRNGAEIQRALLPYLRADGNGAGADAKRLSQLDHGPNGGAMDRLFPLLFAPKEGRWTLRVQDRGAPAARELVVAATTTTARDLAIGAPKPATDWTLAIDDDTAVLTLPTFAFWNSRFDAPAFVAKTFATLAERGTRFLVIDLRANEGGSDAIGHAVLAGLIGTPYAVPGGRRESAYERAPYNLARYLDTWNFDFFDRTGQVRKIEPPSPGGAPVRNWRMADGPPVTVAPAGVPGTPFAGRVVLLVGPQNSSAGYLFARDVKASSAAVLIGQPTGGNLRGLNGGQLAWITLPASKVAVDIPLVAHFVPGNPPDAGVAPDIAVAPSFEDAAAGIDTEMREARALVARWRAGLR